jgi:hypothetical protein
MAAWIKISDTTAVARTIMGLFSSDLDDAGLLQLHLTSSGDCRAVLSEDDGSVAANIIYGSDLRDGNWHLVACAVDSTSLTVWVDNGTDTPVAHTLSFPTIDTMAIGARVDSVTGTPFDGVIDECSLWEGTKLTDANVAAMWALGNNASKNYLSSFASEGIPTPDSHWSLSESLNPGYPGLDEEGGVDLDDYGTVGGDGIPAGEA